MQDFHSVVRLVRKDEQPSAQWIRVELFFDQSVKAIEALMHFDRASEYDNFGGCGMLNIPAL